MTNRWLAGSCAVALALGAGVHVTRSEASDHDDGERDIKARALNLTDHFAFKSPSNPDELSLIMYFNPRSLPGRQYTLSENARYEFHVTRVATRTTAPAPKNDFIFRFEAKAPVDGIQDITLTVFKDGANLSPSMARARHSRVEGDTRSPPTRCDRRRDGREYFVGMRAADSFYFDVNRFFPVARVPRVAVLGGRTATATRPQASPRTAKATPFLANVLAPGSDASTATDQTCSPAELRAHFTKNLNVTAIVLNVPISALGGTIFDTWSTISVKQ